MFHKEQENGEKTNKPPDVITLKKKSRNRFLSE